jgi:thiazole synthase
LAYTLPHPALCQRIEDEGAAAIMPLASPIGSGLGIQQPEALKAILAQSKVPVLVDAGIGAPSDATLAMEMGCAGVLMNTAIAKAENPVLMAQAMRHALEAGRKGFLAGRMPRRSAAEPSTPGAGILPA